MYSGDFADDMKIGYGKLVFSNGDFYAGQFALNQPHGKGHFVGREESFHGVWREGKLVKKM